MGAEEERTGAVPSKTNPEWSEVLDFPVRANEEHGYVLVELLTVVNGQEFLLGHACVPVSTVLVSNDGSKPAFVSEQLEGAAIDSTANVDMELVFLPSVGDGVLHSVR